MNEDEKNQMIVVRVPKELLDAFDKTCPKGERAKKVREIMQQEAEKSGAQTQGLISYHKLKLRADKCRREMERLKKVMNNKLGAVETVALRFAPLESENIPLIIQELCNYPIQPTDGFNRGDIEDYIEYLETMHKHTNILHEIDSYRKANAEITEPIIKRLSSKEKSNESKRRYISPKDLCGCGVYETRAEHNPRCSHILDEMSHGINPHLNTPSAQLLMIRKFGPQHTTSAEEKAMIVEYLKDHGSVNQKSMANAYFKSHNFPIPFPECQSESESEDETPIEESEHEPEEVESGETEPEDDSEPYSEETL